MDFPLQKKLSKIRFPHSSKCGLSYLYHPGSLASDLGLELIQIFSHLG